MWLGSNMSFWRHLRPVAILRKTFSALFSYLFPCCGARKFFFYRGPNPHLGSPAWGRQLWQQKPLCNCWEFQATRAASVRRSFEASDRCPLWFWTELERGRKTKKTHTHKKKTIRNNNKKWATNSMWNAEGNWLFGGSSRTNHMKYEQQKIPSTGATWADVEILSFRTRCHTASFISLVLSQKLSTKLKMVVFRLYMSLRRNLGCEER